MVYVVTDAPEIEAIGTPDEVVLDARTVLTGALDERTSASQSATEAMRQQYDAAESLARLGPIWSDVCAQVLAERHRDVLVEALGREKARTVSDDEAAPALWRLLQQGHDEGHDIVTLLREAAVSRELDSAESLAKVLHHRVERRLAGRVPERAVLPEREFRGSYVERTPEPDGLATPSSLVGTDGRLDYARRVAAAMDRRFWPTWAMSSGGRAVSSAGGRPSWSAAGPFPGTARVGQQQPRSIGLRTCGARSTTWSGPRRLATSGGTRPKTSGRWRSRPTRSSPGGSPRATSTPAPHCSASPRKCWLR